ncbi:MAG: aldose-1-epimerase [Proteobacteria bacterium]|uniref:Aldose-1-epimerase n=1 Tax=Candidatus Avisuccinivibrio stercorigallinarum TaxID=2840704 RepID=A0A9D9GQA7_9GAMM|nr:aldose-1-epimerase [Candidatus Avisuccinivibrio stercorigallinarum]
MLAGGKTVLIQKGGYQAKFVSVGGGMCALTYKGRNIALPHDPDEVPLAHLGKILLPWPNRIKNAAYEFEGVTYTLPVTEARTGSASHGLTAWKEWQIEDLTESSVLLTTMVTAVAGYPFTLKAFVCYSLTDDGLHCTISAVNVGSKAAPYGVGQHPYITCDGEVLDNCTLTFPCSELFEVDEKMCPVKLAPAAASGLDFTAERSLKDVKIDHAYKNPGGECCVSLKGNGLEVCMYTKAPYIQLFTAEKLKRAGLAVEPMSCPANAFNSKTDLIVLKPGDSHSLSYRISAREI